MLKNYSCGHERAGQVSPSWHSPLVVPLPADGGWRLLKFVLSICSLTFCGGLNVSAEFLKFRRILKSGTVKMYLVAIWHTALIWIWNLKCWLASGPWSYQGERSHFKWFLLKPLQFCVIPASENTLLTCLIQALNSVRLPFLSTLSLKHFARGWYWCERIGNLRSGRMKKWLTC